MMRITRNSALLSSGGLALAVTAAVAGNGVGGVFNLGQVNTVNAQTELKGSTPASQLFVNNASGDRRAAAVSAQSTRGAAVRAEARGANGENFGVHATTRSYQGVAGFFRNTGSPPDLTYGTALRALGAGATGNEINRRNHAAAAGEFIGYVGVTGASSYADGGAGVLALNGAGDYGIYATSDSPDGHAGYFRNTSTTADILKGTGLRGIAAGSTGDELPNDAYFRSGGEFIGANGVIGVATRFGGYGVLAVQDRGIYALKTTGHVDIGGNLSVSGHLSKGSGSFKIDHPQDPANKYLSHSFVESPEMKNVYDGIVTTDAQGEAVIELPGYFEALNRDSRYQLTVIGSFAAAQISQKVSGNRFAIKTSEPGVEVSWQVTGIRRNAYAVTHPIVVEEDKQVAERGRYLHPEEHGQPADLAIDAQGRPRQQAQLAAPAR